MKKQIYGGLLVIAIAIPLVISCGRPDEEVTATQAPAYRGAVVQDGFVARTIQARSISEEQCTAPGSALSANSRSGAVGPDGVPLCPLEPREECTKWYAWLLPHCYLY